MFSRIFQEQKVCNKHDKQSYLTRHITQHYTVHNYVLDLLVCQQCHLLYWEFQVILKHKCGDVLDTETQISQSAESKFQRRGKERRRSRKTKPVARQFRDPYWTHIATRTALYSSRPLALYSVHVTRSGPIKSASIAFNNSVSSLIHRVQFVF